MLVRDRVSLLSISTHLLWLVAMHESRRISTKPMLMLLLLLLLLSVMLSPSLLLIWFWFIHEIAD